MIAFPSMLISPATAAGIKTPDDVDNYEPEQFIHWHIYQTVQLAAPMPSASSHWSNASLIASYTEEEAKLVTYQQLLDDGLEVGSSQIYS